MLTGSAALGIFYKLHIFQLHVLAQLLQFQALKFADISLSSIVITWGHVSGHIMITPRFGTCEVVIGDYFLLF